MGLDERAADANTLIEILNRDVFEKAPCANRLAVAPFGYETHVLPKIRESLRFIRTTTTRYIRFAPDFFLIDLEDARNTYLLEIKTTLTPLYSEKRINAIRTEAGDSTLNWTNIGQIESLALDNYMALSGIGVRVAILNYCAYFDQQPLLCDFVERYFVVHRDMPRGWVGSRGSGTPWANFDTRTVRGLEAFLRDEHRLSEGAVKSLVQAAQNELNKRLPMRHNENSPLYSA